ncbi:McrB family protein [Streptomyces aidingensis]|uniref:5-methylcytosine-specific restriction enzyme B n=1 Tax=Streptomyces aidingensis TaxID=910347 RepID=A0A1I1SA39_9ACTN|nr:AAA family ATPase [Streptomyces aidingensis]SFD43306.1 5-methylcytosine-specific restriction enzyme B [Streptomyces aidingensis]
MTAAVELKARAVMGAMKVLIQQPTGHGLALADVWDQLLREDPALADEWVAATGEPVTVLRSRMRFGSIDVGKAGWLRKDGRVWRLTAPGRRQVAALNDDPVGFLTLAHERFSYWDQERASFDRAGELLEALTDDRRWVAIKDLAAAVGLEPEPLRDWLQSARPTGWYLALDNDGEVSSELGLEPGEYDEWRSLLERDGLYDSAASGAYAVRAVLDRQATVAVLRELDSALAPAASAAERPPRRAWLIRGSDPRGMALISGLWRDKGVCTVPADRLPTLAEGAGPAEVREVVETHYSDLNQARRAETVTTLHTFLSRMREGDIVATTDGDRVYLGTVAGPAVQTATGSGTVLQRPVEWRNLDSPLGLVDLPRALAGPLGNPNTGLVDLSEFTGDLEVLLDEDPEQAPTDAGDAAELPDATEELAEKLTMESSMDWLDDCVALLRDRPQLILYGPPGTGKTYTALALARHLTGDREANVKLVQFHPAYSYEDFFEGFRPRAVPLGSGPASGSGGRDRTGGRPQQGSLSDAGSGIVFDLVPGPLKTMAERAQRSPGEIFVLVIDEINRGNLAKVFGELYFLLEYRNEFVHLLYGSDEGRRFWLPRNLVILGTMNSTDRSIALMDAAMRRRFSFMELHPTKPPVNKVLTTWLEQRELPQDAAKLLDALNRRIEQARLEDADFRIGPSYLLRPGLHRDPKGLERVWRHQILPLLTELHWGEEVDIEAEYGLAALREEAGLTSPASSAPAPTSTPSTTAAPSTTTVPTEDGSPLPAAREATP